MNTPTNADPEHALCPVCGEPESGPGSPICSATHGASAPTPPADAQEPPWMREANIIAADAGYNRADAGWNFIQFHVRAACYAYAEQHAAALAQERDALRSEVEKLRAALTACAK